MSFVRSGSVYQLHLDVLGSVRAITDSTGAVVSHFEYGAWGDPLSSSVDGVTGGFFYRYIGASCVRYDSATGLYFMRQRWYDPGLAGFLSRDPLYATNLYAYTENNPSSLADPSGEQVTVTFTTGTTQVVNTAQELFNLLQNAGGNTISKIRIEGHGHPDACGFNPNDENCPEGLNLLSAAGLHPTQVMLGGNNFQARDFSALVSAKLAPGAELVLDACYTSSDVTGSDPGIAQILAKRLPGHTVTGIYGPESELGNTGIVWLPKGSYWKSFTYPGPIVNPP